MDECVFDASFVRLANDSLFGEKLGNLLNRRLNAMRTVVDGDCRIRCNSKLLTEYSAQVRDHRNDVIEQFFSLLDSQETVWVKRSTLSRQDKNKANKCRWPTHDQHVLAAAIGGNAVVIHVTEDALGLCATSVRRIFGFHINHVA